MVEINRRLGIRPCIEIRPMRDKLFCGEIRCGERFLRMVKIRPASEFHSESEFMGPASVDMLCSILPQGCVGNH